MNYLIKEIPLKERPREKIIKNGSDSLSNSELLAVIIKTGTRNASAIELASNIIYQLDDITDLRNYSIEEFTKIKGIGKVKAIEIIAAIELGRRVLALKSKEVSFLKAKDIFLYLRYKMDYPQEHFLALYLNSKCQLIMQKTLFIGTENQTLANNKEVLKHGIKCNAMGIIIVHNHPSGNPMPSNSDIEYTKKLLHATKIMGMEFLDHIIIGNDYYSFKENNIF